MTKIRRILGYISLALGGVSVFAGINPAFPIGLPEGLLLGGVFFALGAWALRSPAIKDFFTRALTSAVRTSAAERVERIERKPQVSIDPLLPVRILKLAKTRAGTLTVAEVAIALNVPLEESEAGLNSCVRSGNALADFDIPRGYALYRFPEFLSPEERKLFLG